MSEDPVALTVGDLWRGLSGSSWTDATLSWPPDVAVLTGALLERSQVFRFVLSPPDEGRWPPLEAGAWPDAVTAAADEWHEWSEGSRGAAPDLVERHWRILGDLTEQRITDIGTGRPWRLCEAVLTLHAVADEACRGIAATRRRQDSGHRFRGRARELLARTGSLARLPTDRARLVPKVHTATAGITHRSLSRYAAARTDGLQTVWHKVPVRRPGDARSQQANVLLLPWPLVVQEQDFRPVPGTRQRPERDPFGLFRYAPSTPLDLHLMDQLVASATAKVGPVDAVILPEVALDEAQVDDVEAILARHAAGVLIAGIRTAPASSQSYPGNAVHLGVRLGGQWWHYRQAKHHRWYLEANQIAQYHLESALDPGVRWWEAMNIPQRSIQFVELGEGVTLAAVVCEDLARLDGVADLLRSVGPTLVVVLLLDGPQIAPRWTARYATVLADDPGSAVITLTPFGMVDRSRPPGMLPSRAVALWKDPASGLREITLDEGAEGVLVHMSVEPATRYAADGRRPADDGSQLVLGTVTPVTIDPTITEPAPPDVQRLRVPEITPRELTVLAGWAETVAEALGAGPDAMTQVLDDLRPGAPWRKVLGLDEPDPILAQGFETLASLVRSLTGDGSSVDVAGALARLGADDHSGEPMTHRVRRLVRNALESALPR